MYFLGALSPARRRRFVAEAERLTREELERMKHSRHMQVEDPIERLASRGVIHELEGRLRWLREVGKELEKPD